MSDILALAFELKDKVLESDLYKDLKEKEKRMFEDEECSKILYEFQVAKSQYEEEKRFEKYGSNPESTYQKLSEIKYKLDENKCVKEYNLAYKKMKKRLREIEKIVFKDIVSEKKVIEIE